MKIIHNAFKEKEQIIIKSAAVKDRIDCIKYLMSFYLIFNHHLKHLDECIVFDKWADMKLPMLQMSVSTITMFANDGKVQDACEFFIEQINEK